MRIVNTLGGPFERLTWEGNVGRSSSAGTPVTPDADAVRVLYEQIGVLYACTHEDDERSIGHPDAGVATEELASFLDTVRRALINPAGAAVLHAALVRYETDRTRGDST